MKIYKIYGKIEYQFNGDNEIFIRVVKEDSKKIVGIEAGLFGNQTLEDYNKEDEGNKITIIKSNVTGWLVLK